MRAVSGFIRAERFSFEDHWCGFSGVKTAFENPWYGFGMHLQAKDETVLLSELKSLVAREREVTSEILGYLAEVESRKLHLERGYPSLFEFVVRELGYSAGSAYRRIAAMRLVRALPEYAPRIESGELSLSVAAQAQGFFREEGKRRKISIAEKQATVEGLLGLSTRECERKLAAISPESMLPKERERVVTEELTQIQFLADRALLEKLECLKGRLGHGNYEGSYAKLFHQLADLALRKLIPAKNEAGCQPPAEFRESIPVKPKPVKLEPGKSKPLESKALKSEALKSETQKAETLEKAASLKPAPSKSELLCPTRFIPKAMKVAVWERDRGKCVYRDRKTGRSCGSLHALECDHVTPLVMGGGTSVENLRLLCAAHHRLETAKLAMLV